MKLWFKRQNKFKINYINRTDEINGNVSWQPSWKLPTWPKECEQYLCCTTRQVNMLSAITSYEFFYHFFLYHKVDGQRPTSPGANGNPISVITNPNDSNSLQALTSYYYSSHSHGPNHSPAPFAGTVPVSGAAHFSDPGSPNSSSLLRSSTISGLVWVNLSSFVFTLSIIISFLPFTVSICCVYIINYVF